MKISIFLIISLLNSILSNLTFQLNNRARCYIEELFDNSVAMIKWKIRNVPAEDEKKKSINLLIIDVIENVHINIFKESNDQLLKTEYIKAEKGKISFMSPEAGQYKICAIYYGPAIKDLSMGIKIHSDNMDEPRLNLAIKNEDVIPLNEKVADILSKGKGIIKKQEAEIEDEDGYARFQMTISKNYYILTVIQIIIIISLGIYQIYSFRKFLSLNNVI